MRSDNPLSANFSNIFFETAFTLIEHYRKSQFGCIIVEYRKIKNGILALSRKGQCASECLVTAEAFTRYSMFQLPKDWKGAGGTLLDHGPSEEECADSRLSFQWEANDYLIYPDSQLQNDSQIVQVIDSTMGYKQILGLANRPKRCLLRCDNHVAAEIKANDLIETIIPAELAHAKEFGSLASTLGSPYQRPSMVQILDPCFDPAKYDPTSIDNLARD